VSVNCVAGNRHFLVAPPQFFGVRTKKASLPRGLFYSIVPIGESEIKSASTGFAGAEVRFQEAPACPFPAA
jgi:hypothetical protein